MNERIRELAEQATRTLEVKHEGYRGNGYTEQVEFFDKEKFAQLIVQECADLMNSNKDSDRHVMWNRALYETRGKIFRHFGVEE